MTTLPHRDDPAAQRIRRANAIAAQRAELHVADSLPTPTVHHAHMDLPHAADVEEIAAAFDVPVVWVTPTWAVARVSDGHGRAVTFHGRTHRCAHTQRNLTGACIACGQRPEGEVSA